MKHSHTPLIPVILLATTLSACATVQLGRQFDLEAFKSQVERGSTTQEQIRQWLGAPKSSGIVVETSGDKYLEWTYFFGYGKLGDLSHAEMKILQIKFDQQGVVRGYNYSADTK
jgi:outer membrane protein assembly factor BamE (lipoprotein component of BamABCDE complex)